MLRNLRHDYGIRSPQPRQPDGRRAPTPHRDENGRYSVTGLAAHYQVSPHVVRYWVSRRIVTPKRDYPGGPFWFELTDDAHNRLAEALQRGYTARRQKPQTQTFPSTSEQEAY